MFAGFQSNAFQNDAFQIVVELDNGWLGGGADVYSFVHAYDKYKAEEYQRRLKEEKLKLAKLEQELAEAEKLRQQAEQQALAEQREAEFIAELELAMQAEIRRLRLERVELIRRINEYEAAIVIMAMYARRKFRRLTN